MNPFFLLEKNHFDRKSPSRVYGLLTQTEFRDSPQGEISVQFDCVDADWFDRNESALTYRYAEAIPLFILEVRSTAERLGRLLAFDGDLTNQEPDRWFAIQLGRDRSELEGQIRFGLSDREGSLIQLERLSEVSLDVETRLGKFQLPMSRRRGRDIASVLGRVNSIGSARVFDVGQGSCAAAIGKNEGVEAYFDFGGGVGSNHHTFPTQLAQFCFTGDPPVILSHWDWDHWSSALRDRRALQCDWIAPAQKIGAIQWAFVQQLLGHRGRLFIWPKMLNALRVNQIEIQKCMGSGRNSSGLAVLLHDEKNGDRMLFPGDAQFSSIPGILSGVLTTLVVPHHGGKPFERNVPQCSGQSHHRLVYSFGGGNSYGHSAAATAVIYAQNGWSSANLRETKNRANNGLGHVHLPFSSAPLGKLPCLNFGPGCSLGPSQ